MCLAEKLNKGDIIKWRAIQPGTDLQSFLTEVNSMVWEKILLRFCPHISIMHKNYITTWNELRFEFQDHL